MILRALPALWALTLALSLASVALADPPPRATVAQTPRSVTPPSQNSPTAAPSEGVVNINTATEEELVRLPGIGPARALAIVQLRARIHHFGRADDLRRVRGIGPVGMRRLRPFVATTGPTTLLARPGRPPRALPGPSQTGGP